MENQFKIFHPKLAPVKAAFFPLVKKEGMPEIAEQIFDLPMRRGVPAGVGGLADHLSNPACASALGLVLYAHRHRQHEPVGAGSGAFTRMVSRLRTVFKEFF